MNFSVDTLFYGLEFRKLMERELQPVCISSDLQKIDLMILYYLSKSGEHDTSSDMMDLKMFTRGHISQALTRLENHGYIDMKTDSKDHRCTHNSITNKGNQLVKEIEKHYKNIHNIIFKDISSEEKKVLMKVANKINENIDKAINI